MKKSDYRPKADFLIIEASSLLWLDFFFLDIFSPEDVSSVKLKAALDPQEELVNFN